MQLARTASPTGRQTAQNVPSSPANLRTSSSVSGSFDSVDVKGARVSPPKDAKASLSCSFKEPADIRERTRGHADPGGEHVGSCIATADGSSEGGIEAVTSDGEGENVSTL